MFPLALQLPQSAMRSAGAGVCTAVIRYLGHQSVQCLEITPTDECYFVLTPSGAAASRIKLRLFLVFAARPRCVHAGGST